MKVAIRWIFKSGLASPCEILELTETEWQGVLNGDTRDIVCSLLNMEQEKENIIAFSWLPLDGMNNQTESDLLMFAKNTFRIATKQMNLQSFLEMNPSLSGCHVSSLIDLTKETAKIAKRRHPTVNDLILMSGQEIINSQQVSRETVVILKEMLASYGLSLKENDRGNMS